MMSSYNILPIMYHHVFRLEEALENNEDGEIMEMDGEQMEDEVDSNNGTGWPVNTMSDPGGVSLSTPPMQSVNVLNRMRSLSQNEGIVCLQKLQLTYLLYVEHSMYNNLLFCNLIGQFEFVMVRCLLHGVVKL